MKKLKLEELGRLSPEQFEKTAKIPVSVVLDNLRSALNVGSIFRSSDAFAIGKIYLTGITAIPPNREILKTAIGSSLTVPWEYHENVAHLLEALKKDGQHIIGIEQTSESCSLSNYQLKRENLPLTVVLGNEVEGISEEALKYLDESILIDQFGTKHSLNVAVCGGIILWKMSQMVRDIL